jgi:putative MFS transporter
VSVTASHSPPTPFTPYQRRLFVFLSVATFFEGYDFIALSQILPQLKAAMALSDTGLGAMVTLVNLGTLVAFGLVGLADRWGRKRLLTVTIIGYTVTTFLTGFATNVVFFTALQFLARMFLIAEWATSMVYAAEEFPSERRGMVIGVIQAFSSLGAIVCAGLVPSLLRIGYGWRSVYLVGILPLIVLMYARRGLRESSSFTEEVAKRAADRSMFHIWKTPFRNRMLLLAVIWGLGYICTSNATTFWKQFVMVERGLTDQQVALAISIAAVGSMPLVFCAGKLLDVIGRKRGAVVIFLTGAAGVVAAYGAHGFAALTASLTVAIFGAAAFLPVMNTFTAELFPTELRADAFGWSNNLLGRITYVVSPFFIGMGAARVGWGLAIQLTAIGPILALLLILTTLPETRSMDLDKSAAL